MHGGEEQEVGQGQRLGLDLVLEAEDGTPRAAGLFFKQSQEP